MCVELRVTQRFLSIIHRAAAASVLLFNSPADHIIPSPQPKAICETRALQGNSINAPTNEASHASAPNHLLDERNMHVFVYKTIRTERVAPPERIEMECFGMCKSALLLTTETVVI